MSIPPHLKSSATGSISAFGESFSCAEFGAFDMDFSEEDYEAMAAEAEAIAQERISKRRDSLKSQSLHSSQSSHPGLLGQSKQLREDVIDSFCEASDDEGGADSEGNASADGDNEMSETGGSSQVDREKKYELELESMQLPMRRKEGGKAQTNPSLGPLHFSPSNSEDQEDDVQGNVSSEPAKITAPLNAAKESNETSKCPTEMSDERPGDILNVYQNSIKFDQVAVSTEQTIVTDKAAPSNSEVSNHISELSHAPEAEGVRRPSNKHVAFQPEEEHKEGTSGEPLGVSSQCAQEEKLSEEIENDVAQRKLSIGKAVVPISPFDLRDMLDSLWSNPAQQSDDAPNVNSTPQSATPTGRKPYLSLKQKDKPKGRQVAPSDLSCSGSESSSRSDRQKSQSSVNECHTRGIASAYMTDFEKLGHASFSNTDLDSAHSSARVNGKNETHTHRRTKTDPNKGHIKIKTPKDLYFVNLRNDDHTVESIREEDDLNDVQSKGVNGDANNSTPILKQNNKYTRSKSDEVENKGKSFVGVPTKNYDGPSKSSQKPSKLPSHVRECNQKETESSHESRRCQRRKSDSGSHVPTQPMANPPSEEQQRRNSEGSESSERSSSTPRVRNKFKEKMCKIEKSQDRRTSQKCKGSTTDSHAKNERSNGNRVNKYSLGDVLLSQNDIIQESSIEQAAKKLSELQVFDNVFIKRSNGSWTYAIVASIAKNEILFVLNKEGGKKIIERKNWVNSIRRLNESKRRNSAPRVREKGLLLKEGRGLSKSIPVNVEYCEQYESPSYEHDQEELEMSSRSHVKWNLEVPTNHQ